MNQDPAAEPHTILCMKWGDRYGPHYVNRLYGMVSRHLREPFRLVCFTEDSHGVRPEVECLPLPELGCDPPERTRGKWRKVSLWNRDLAGLEGTALFIDLDTVIIGDIAPYFHYGAGDEVILERNWAKPFLGLGQTSIFRFRIGSRPDILAGFRANPQSIADRFRFEQHYITHCAGKQLRFWPRGWTRHFRIHCLGPVPLRYLRPAVRPRRARMVTFPGGPNPAEAAAGKWRPDSPPYEGRRRHLRRALTGPNPLREIRTFVMPVDWIGEEWRE